MPILLNKNTAFPDPALADAEGLVAIGGDFGTERLLAAYRQGIFPWTANPITVSYTHLKPERFSWTMIMSKIGGFMLEERQLHGSWVER